MKYAVKEIFHTLQGEGFHSGRAAVFCRFAGCNLWSGRERDRADAECRFCDTDFLGTDGTEGGIYSDADELARACLRVWRAGVADGAAGGGARPMIVCTGGEPLLQMDAALVEALRRHGFYIAVETNGTLPAPDGIDWICVSPKAGAAFVLRAGNELKLIYPQPGMDPEELLELSFDHFFLQPMDGDRLGENTAAAAHYCMTHPGWRLSIQKHKIAGIR